jgi:hypothetical protein
MSFGAPADAQCFEELIRLLPPAEAVDLESLEWLNEEPAGLEVPGYRLVRGVGSIGAAGEVSIYESDAGGRIAIKITRGVEANERRFVEFLDSVANLGKPLHSVVQSRLLFSGGGHEVYAMQAASHTLGSLVGQLSVAQAVTIAAGLLRDALSVYRASGKHYVYTDLKLENCMYLHEPTGLRFVLVDLGSFVEEHKSGGLFCTTPPLDEVVAYLNGPRRRFLKAHQRLFTYSLAVVLMQLVSAPFYHAHRAQQETLSAAVDFKAQHGTTPLSWFFNRFFVTSFERLVGSTHLAHEDKADIVALSEARTLEDGAAVLHRLERCERIR